MVGHIIIVSRILTSPKFAGYVTAFIVTPAVVDGIIYGSVSGLISDLFFGITFEKEIGDKPHLVFAINFEITVGVIYGTVAAITSGIGSGITSGLLPESHSLFHQWGINSVGSGILFGIIFGFIFGIDFGLALGLALGGVFGISAFRVYYFPMHIFFVWRRLRGISYRRHPVAWDDLCSLPFPGLDRLLVAYAEAEPVAAAAEIERLIDHYLSQRMQALKARTILIARGTRAGPVLSRLDLAIAGLPEGQKEFRGYCVGNDNDHVIMLRIS